MTPHDLPPPASTSSNHLGQDPFAKRLYVDHAACAPLRPDAKRAAEAVLALPPGHPSSPHANGRRLAQVIEDARDQVAQSLGTRPRQVVFTSGATEAARIAIEGLARAAPPSKRRILVSSGEHPAVLGAALGLSQCGFSVSRVRLTKNGQIDCEHLDSLLDESVACAAFMAINHETGVCYDASVLAASLSAYGVPWVCDAALAPGQIPVDAESLPADVLLLSASKVGGLHGGGALVLRTPVKLLASASSGMQEEGLRGGTHAVAPIASLGVALQEAIAMRSKHHEHIRACIDSLTQRLSTSCGATIVSGRAPRAPGFATFHIPRCRGETMLMHMDLEGISIGTGSRCALGGTDVSPTLLAMGLREQDAAETIRVSITHPLDDGQQDRLASTLVRGVETLLSTLG